MTGWVHAFLATGDTTFKDYAMLRTTDIVNPARPKNHAAKMFMTQGSHPLTGYPTPNRFYMPWQHGPVILGYLAGNKFFGSALCLQIAEDVPTAVEYAWVTNVNDPKFGFVANGLRYYVPTQYQGAPIPANFWDNTPGIGIKFGDSPLGGAHGFLVGALHALAARTQDVAVQAKALKYANILLGPVNNNKRWYKWNFNVEQAFLSGGGGGGGG